MTRLHTPSIQRITSTLQRCGAGEPSGKAHWTFYSQTVRELAQPSLLTNKVGLLNSEGNYGLRVERLNNLIRPKISK